MKKACMGFAVVVFGLVFFAAARPAHAEAAPCETFGADPFFFENYERVEYINGLLTVHLRLRADADPTTEWILGFRIYDQDCKILNWGSLGKISLRPTTRSYSIRWTSPNRWEIWDDETNTPEPCPGCQGTIYGPSPYAPWTHTGILNGNPDSSFVTTSYPRAEPPLDPVIIIPGILGSWQKNGTWVIDPVLHTYDNLIANLVRNGFEQGTTLFTFPYQWRDSNVQTAALLKQKIQDVKAVCNCPKVDLVAHSMGGLAARQYVQSDDYAGDVDQLIFLGVPHEGAPKDYLLWEGATLPDNFENNLLKFYVKYEALKNGFLNLYDYIHDRPIASAQELLPIYDYLRDDGTNILRQYPNGYPRNAFLENLRNNSSRLDASGVRMINIVGDVGPSSTISELRVVDSPTPGLWEHGYPKDFDDEPDHGLINGPGDGTVPLDSTTAIPVTDTRVTNYWHRDLVTQAEDQVIGALTPKRPIVLFDKGWIGNLLFTKILSPVDVQIIAPDGKRIGKDFATGQEINEIEDAFYSGFLTDDEYVAIPNPLDGEYRIITQGTDAGGEYTVATSYITEQPDGTTTSAEADYVGMTTPGTVQELKAVIDNTNPDTIVIEPVDDTPPSLVIQSPIEKSYLHSEMLPIAVSMTDESGIANHTLTVDTIPVANNTTLDLFYQKLGAHRLTATATDMFGNMASSSVSFQIIATYDSAMSDTNRAFTLGWIKSTTVRKEILEELKEARTVTKPSKADNMLTELLKYIEERKRMFTAQGYLLITEDIEWIRTHN